MMDTLQAREPVTADHADPGLFFNRELSWLAFNERVVEEAADPTTPLVERVKFAAIAASNLDEFFMVRVAAIKQAIDEDDGAADLSGRTPAQQFAAVRDRAHAFGDGRDSRGVEAKPVQKGRGQATFLPERHVAGVRREDRGLARGKLVGRGLKSLLLARRLGLGQ